MNRNKLIGYFIILLLVQQNIFSQHRIRFQRISIEQGLTQSTVYQMFQDELGFMWFCTQDGLNKYDGYKFEVVHNEPNNPGSISNNYVYCATQDKAGNIWLGTNGGGMNMYNPRTALSERFLYDFNNSNSISANIVRALAIDENGNVWIGTEGGGLCKFNSEKKTFTRFLNEGGNKSIISASTIFSLCIDKQNNLWIGTEANGLYCYNLKTEKITRYTANPLDNESLGSNKILCIHQDFQQNLWIGTENGGLHQLNMQTKKFKRYLHDDKNPFSISGNTIYAVMQDNDGVLWIGTEGGGVNKYNISENKFFAYTYNVIDPTSISSNHVLSLFQDFSGNIWVGTSGGGFNVFNTRTALFMQFGTSENVLNKLSNKKIWCFYEDKKGDIWIGTDGGGINIYNTEKDEMTYMLHNPYIENTISNNRIRSIIEDRKGNMWIGTDGGGINKIDAVTKKITTYLNNPNNPNSLSANRIRILNEDKAGNIWVGTYASGLNKFISSQNTFIRYLHNPLDPLSISSNTVRSLYFDNYNNLWIGTYNGLNLMDINKGTFRKFVNIPADNTTISNNLVFSVHLDCKNNLWIGTDGGLNKMHLRCGFMKKMQYRILPHNKFNIHAKSNNDVFFEHFTTENGLPNNVIYSIVPDAKSNLWISTNNGISKFTPCEFQETKNQNSFPLFRNYDQSDGLQSNEFNAGAYYKAKNNLLFFGGINGFNAFYPEQIIDDTIKPYLAFTNFQIFNKPVKIINSTYINSLSLLQQTLYVDKSKNIDNNELEYKIKANKIIKIDNSYFLPQHINYTKEINLTYKESVLTIDFAALHFSNPEKNLFQYTMEGFDKDWNELRDRRSATYTNLTPGKYIFKLKGSNCDGVWNLQPLELTINISPPFYATLWFRISAIILLIIVVFGGFIVYVKLRERNLHKTKKFLEQKIQERTAEAMEQKSKIEQSYQNIKLLSDIGQKITSTLSREQIVDTVYQNVNMLMDAAVFIIGVYNPYENHLEFPGGKEKGVNVPLFTNNMEEERLAIWCFKNQKDIVILNYEKDYKNYLNIELPPVIGEITESIIYLPLNLKDKTIGVISVQSFNKNAYTQYHIGILKNLAVYTAIALDNANAYQEIESQKTKIQEALNELQTTQQQLVEAEKMAALGQLIAGVAHEINTPLGAIKSSVANISKAIKTTFQEIPEFISILDEKEQKLFFTFLDKAIINEKFLSSREARIIKRNLIQRFIELKIENPESIADSLTDIGLIEDYDEFLLLLQNKNNIKILEMAYQLTGAFRSSQTIATATDKASKVVFALKNYARFDQSGALVKSEIVDGIETVLTLYQNQIKHGIEIYKNFDIVEPFYCYPDELNQVWTNLIHNAIQAMENKGLLIIDVHIVPNIFAHHKDVSDWVNVSITDSGKGIPDPIKEKIFNPFFTTKPKGEGSGLGLDIVKKIIAKHKGEINFESQPGKTTFNVYVPYFTELKS